MACEKENTVTFTQASPVIPVVLACARALGSDCPGNVDVANLEPLPGSELSPLPCPMTSPSVVFRECASTCLDSWDSPDKLE